MKGKSTKSPRATQQGRMDSGKTTEANDTTVPIGKTTTTVDETNATESGKAAQTNARSVGGKTTTTDVQADVADGVRLDEVLDSGKTTEANDTTVPIGKTSTTVDETNATESGKAAQANATSVGGKTTTTDVQADVVDGVRLDEVLDSGKTTEAKDTTVPIGKTSTTVDETNATESGKAAQANATSVGGKTTTTTDVQADVTDGVRLDEVLDSSKTTEAKDTTVPIGKTSTTVDETNATESGKAAQANATVVGGETTTTDVQADVVDGVRLDEVLDSGKTTEAKDTTVPIGKTTTTVDETNATESDKKPEAKDTTVSIGKTTTMEDETNPMESSKAAQANATSVGGKTTTTDEEAKAIEGKVLANASNALNKVLESGKASLSNNSVRAEGVGHKRLFGDEGETPPKAKLTPNDAGSTKRGKNELFEFADYPDKIFRKQGYYSCPLAEVVDYLNPGKAVIFLAKRQLPRQKPQVLTKLVPVIGEAKRTERYRFDVQFVSRSFNPQFAIDGKAKNKTARTGVWKYLDQLYNQYLMETLKTEMNDGDEDQYFRAADLISSVLDDKHTTHILITAVENGESDKDCGCTVPIAAVSFCSNDGSVGSNSLMIGACAVSDGKFTKKFGTAADDKSWRRRGLLAFLLMAARKLHRSIYHSNGELWCYIALRQNYSCLPVFQKLGFTPVANNFKDCFGVPNMSNASRLRYVVTNKRPAKPVFVPFLAEGTVYGCAGTFVCRAFFLRVFRH
jgi:hypothetical protein